MTRAFLLPFAAASFSLLVFTGSVLTPARGQGRGQSFALPDGPGKDTIQTGQFKEYPVKTPASGPHGLEFDQDGNLWFTANSKGYVGKLDPKTGEITEYKLPADVRDRSLYGITYLDGAIWYAESAIKPNVLVRFDIKTEKFQSWIIPGGGGVVRNIKATDDGKSVMAESGVNKIALVDVR